MSKTNRLSLFSTKKYEKVVFSKFSDNFSFELDYLEQSLDSRTAHLAEGSQVVSIFVNDKADEEALRVLSRVGVRGIALRSAGFNHVNLDIAKELRIKVARVPAYSPHAVAEHAVALLLCLNRKLHKAYNRVREGNLSLEGLTGFDLHGKTVGVIGLGKIGLVFSKIMSGFGCRVLAHDPKATLDKLDFQISLVDKEQLFRESDIISLHCPLTSETKHIINADSLDLMKPSVVLINTGRGALIDTKAIITSLKGQKIGAVGLDVYEEEEGLFFSDHSQEIISDDVFSRLLTFPNVLITGHQAFLTTEALANIAQTTLCNARDLFANQINDNYL